MTHNKRSFKIEYIQNLQNIGPVLIILQNLKNNDQRNIKLYHKINKERVKEKLNHRNKEKVFTTEEIDQKVTKLHTNTKQHDKEIPNKDIQTNNMGLNKKTRELIKNRRRLLNTMKKNKSNNTLKKQLKDLNRNKKRKERRTK